MLNIAPLTFYFLRLDGADGFGRAAEGEHPGRDNGALCDQGTGAQHAAILQDSAVEYDAAHADEYMVAHGAAVQDAAVADGHIAADMGGKAFIHMNDAAILYVGALPMLIGAISPRMTALYQILALAEMVTSPEILAPGSTVAVCSIDGCFMRDLLLIC